MVKNKIPWDMDTLSKVPQIYPAKPPFKAEGLKAIFIQGPKFEGKETRIFAWYGLPKRKKENIPAMVLIAGGAGTACSKWVKIWNKKGYAAICADSSGFIPHAELAGPETRKRHKYSGPSLSFAVDKPLKDQWTFHSISAAILAHSFIRSLPEVDPEKTGVTGISWGGYQTCIISGVDHRFKLAVPVYGCGHYELSVAFKPSLDSLGKTGKKKWLSQWDPSQYLMNSHVPMLWLTGPKDFHFPLPALQLSYTLPKGERYLCVKTTMKHSMPSGWNPKENYKFADSILKNEMPFTKITDQSKSGRTAWISFKSEVPIKSAEFAFTTDTNEKWNERKWKTTPIYVNNPKSGRITCKIPEGTIAYYFNLIDERNLLISSEHIVI